MSTLRKGISLGLMVCLFHLCIVDVAWPVEESATDATAVKQQVKLLGVGAQVKLRLADGTKLSGAIQGIEDTAFELTTPAGNPAKVAYDQVSNLRLATKPVSYRASSKVDPAEARRTALSLAGKHVNVSMTGGDKVHGFIQAIEQDHFTLLPSGGGTPMPIAYADVAKLEGHSSRWPIYVALSAAGGLILALAIVASLAGG